MRMRSNQRSSAIAMHWMRAGGLMRLLSTLRNGSVIGIRSRSRMLAHGRTCANSKRHVSRALCYIHEHRDPQARSLVSARSTAPSQVKRNRRIITLVDRTAGRCTAQRGHSIRPAATPVVSTAARPRVRPTTSCKSTHAMHQRPTGIHRPFGSTREAKISYSYIPRSQLCSTFVPIRRVGRERRRVHVSSAARL